jgi:ABC-2 type transport system ATP-binding protein
MDDSHVIEIENLRKEYHRAFRPPKVSVDGLTLRVRRGDVFGLIGPNGAGKTTTIKCLLGFVRPTSGTLRLLGRPGDDPRVRARLGFLPETAVYYPFLTARRTLLMYARLFGLSGREARTRVDSLLELVHLTPHADDKIQTYSKGMAQRVGIAQALLNDPEVMILDEPATGLDPVGQKEIRDLIFELRARGKTVFFSSHELGEVESVCDRVAMVVGGRIRREGTRAELCPVEDAWTVRVRGPAEALKTAAEAVGATLVRGTTDEQYWRLAGVSSLGDLAARFSPHSGVKVLGTEQAQKSLEDVFLETLGVEPPRHLKPADAKKGEGS